MFKELKDRACIVGVGETPFCRKPGSSLSEMGIQLRAAMAAIEDAGLKAQQIDGIMPFPNVGKAEAFAASLGCANLRFAATLHLGGAAPVGSLRAATMAVATGAADYVLCRVAGTAFRARACARPPRRMSIRCPVAPRPATTTCPSA